MSKLIPLSEINNMPVKEFHRFNDPHNINPNRIVYRFYAHVKDIPNGIPMDPNPRQQKTNTAVAKNIRESLLSTDDKTFYLKNRGILLTADSVRFDNKTKTVNIRMVEGSKNGNVDGGHTYLIIQEELKKGSNPDQYVHIEIAVGCEEIADNLAEARNTSVQVDEKSIAELRGKLNPIKRLIQNTIFSDRVAYVQNAQSNTDLPPIDVRDVIAVLQIFNQKLFQSEQKTDKHPTICYTSKVAAMKSYLKAYDEAKQVNAPHEFEYMKYIVEDIFKLYNHIEHTLPKVYNENKGAYGSRKYSLYNKNNIVSYATFGKGIKEEDGLKYAVPKGILLPLLASFRALVEVDSQGYYKWKDQKKPIEVFEELGAQLSRKAIGMCETLSNSPDAFAKDQNSWDLLYKHIVISTL